MTRRAAVVLMSAGMASLGACQASRPKPAAPIRIEVVETGAASMLLGVGFADRHAGVAVGGDGERDPSVVLRTSDGGETWEPVGVEATGRLYAVDFADTQRGAAVGYGVALYTCDGGTSWARSSAEALDRTWLGGIAFASASSAYAVGGGAQPVLWATSDGGATWSDRSPLLPGEARGHGLRTVVFFDGDHGVIGGTEGLLLTTDDGGSSWSTVPTGSELAWVKGLATFGDRLGYAVGSHGVVLRSTSRGASWARVDLPGAPKLNVAGCLDEQYAVVGSMEGRLYATEDGGSTWTTARAEVGRALIGSARRPAQHDELWICGDRGLLLRIQRAR